MALFSHFFVRKRAISLATTVSLPATSFALAQDPAGRHAHAVPIPYVADQSTGSVEQAFLSENDTAMNRMMESMRIKSTGDVDRDFVAMMVPHHQGAADMANAELKYGHNEKLRRLAQEIVTSQQQEILAMRNAVSDGQSAAAQSLQSHPEAVRTDGSSANGEMKMSR
jgi:hypothetical protein